MKNIFTALLLLIMLEMQWASAREAGPSGLPLSSSFGVRHDPITGQKSVHQGIDIPVPLHTPVYAAESGTVSYAGIRGGYGLMIEILHADGSRTRYAHLSRSMVQPGDRVTASSLIGLAGSTGHSTGPHLHFEYWVGNRAVDPLLHINRMALSSVDGGWKATDGKIRVDPPFRSAYAQSLADHQKNVPPRDDALPDGVEISRLALPDSGAARR